MITEIDSKPELPEYVLPPDMVLKRVIGEEPQHIRFVRN